MARPFVLFLAILLMGVGVCWAADNPAVGKWDCVGTGQNGYQTRWAMIVSEEQGRLSGVLSGEVEISMIAPKLEGNDFTFKIRINPKETVEVKVTIKGKRFEGTFKGVDSGIGTFSGVKQA